jgi:DNA-binding CsgD family transcriptional regulator
LASAFGIATLFLPMESNRLLVLGDTGEPLSATFAPHIVGFVAIAVFAWGYCRMPRLFRPRPFAEVAVAVLYFMAKLVLLGLSIIPANEILVSSSLFFANIGEAILLFIWFRELALLGARFAVRSYAQGIIILAALNCLTLLLVPEAVRGMVALLPLVSICCLFSFRRAKGSASPLDDSLLFAVSARTRARKLLLALASYVSLACLSLVFGQLHQNWLYLQDGSVVSLAVQLATATGTALGSLFILGMLRYFWNHRGIELCRLLLFGIVVLALWLSVFAEVGSVFLFVMLLNVVQKLSFFLILASPFIIDAKSDRMAPLPLSYLGFSVGKILGGSLFMHADSNIIVLCLVAALMLLLFSSSMPALFGSLSELAGPTSSHETPDTASALMPESAPAEQREGSKIKRCCAALAQDYALTARETEILFLLARGRTASYIAQELVISPTTAKTHLRTIYTKLGLHSQQQILSLVEETIELQHDSPAQTVKPAR